MFIPPSPDSLDPPKPLPQPPRLPDPPPGSLYPAHGTPISAPWAVPYTPWFVKVQPVPLLLFYHLCYNPTSRNPVLNWDLIHPPDSTRIVDPYDQVRPMKSPAFTKEAFQPTATKTWITSVNPIIAPWIHRWGAIIIDKEADKKPITVGDILNAIFAYFHTPLTQEDMDFLSLEPANTKSLKAVIKLRARDSYELDPVVMAAGYRRVDLLGSYRRFKGLEIIVLPDNTWRLHMIFSPMDPRPHDHSDSPQSDSETWRFDDPCLAGLLLCLAFLLRLSRLWSPGVWMDH